LEAAEGNGPVAAMDAALRKALVNFYPEIESFHLTDYKVRILDGAAGTSAKTRVLIESSNGQQRGQRSAFPTIFWKPPIMQWLKAWSMVYCCQAL